jgi:hypothetical protein
MGIILTQLTEHSLVFPAIFRPRSQLDVSRSWTPCYSTNFLSQRVRIIPGVALVSTDADVTLTSCSYPRLKTVRGLVRLRHPRQEKSMGTKRGEGQHSHSYLLELLFKERWFQERRSSEALHRVGLIRQISWARQIPSYETVLHARKRNRSFSKLTHD